jgi:glycine/serine hydroxymethyltransferase
MQPSFWHASILLIKYWVLICLTVVLIAWFAGVILERYTPVFYGVEKETGLIDMDKVAEIAEKEHPKLIICGASAYSRDWDYKRFRDC